ncbi:ETC complex I subunit [Rubellimicrobium arenae]|uniref:ETC complex I subunit n=1 Tax=Rubellimicrobium arenae TaxID=2817372 RepID=UPI001B30E619|nr:ETC complex I subunit [Rubellimicrobium arenae]
MRGRIIKMPRNNTQIGSNIKGDWVLDFEPASERHIDPLMGWTSTSDMQSEVRLTFDSKEAALAYALKHGIEVVVQPEQGRKPNIRPGGYGENFSASRRRPWTH